MAGNAKLAALQRRLDATFDRVAAFRPDDFELLSDFARYLCVLVSGYLESAIAELALEHCRHRCSPTVLSYVDAQLGRFQNPNAERVLQLLGAFDPLWRTDLETFISGERKDAIDSVVALRNKIAHGESVGITYRRIKDYYTRTKEVIDFLSEKLA